MAMNPQQAPADLPSTPSVPRRLWLAAIAPALFACLCFALARTAHKPITSDYLRLQDIWLLPVQLLLAGLTLAALPLAAFIMPGWRRAHPFTLSGQSVAGFTPTAAWHGPCRRAGRGMRVR